MATELHQRLMRLAFELTQRGEADLAAWIQKNIAYEQTKGRRKRGVPKVEVTLARTGRSAYVPKAMVEAVEGGDE